MCRDIVCFYFISCPLDFFLFQCRTFCNCFPLGSVIHTVYVQWGMIEFYRALFYRKVKTHLTCTCNIIWKLAPGIPQLAQQGLNLWLQHNLTKNKWLNSLYETYFLGLPSDGRRCVESRYRSCTPKLFFQNVLNVIKKC